jgi:hypothetical protein
LSSAPESQKIGILAAGKVPRAFFACAGFAHSEIAAMQIAAVERVHRGGASSVIRHRDKAETARAASRTISDEGDICDLPVLFEKILEIVFSGLESEISYVQFHVFLMEGRTASYKAVPGNRVSNAIEEILT